MTRCLIRNATVVSIDSSIGNLPRADILIEDGRIAEIGTDLEASADEVFDAEGYIASPGFVDTHHHVWQTAMRSLTADWSLGDYVAGIRVVASTRYRPQDMYAATRHGLVEALHVGVTTTADYCHNILSPDYAEEALRGTIDSGARSIWCYGFNTPPGAETAFPDVDARGRFLEAFASRHFSSRDSRITLGVCPEESLFWEADPSVGAKQFRFARACDARVFWHCNSSRSATGQPTLDVAAIAEHDLVGPDMTLVHMGGSHDTEWDRVADAGASFSFTPETELQMGMAFPNIERAQQKGIPFGFGIDIVSNNSADLRFALRMVLQAERHRRSENGGIAGIAQQGLDLSCADALRWGTLDGARACGLEQSVGSLTPGKRADILLHDTRHLTMVGYDPSQPEAALILHGNPEALRHVLVDGKFVKRDGVVEGAESASRQLAETSEHIFGELERLGGTPGILAAGYEVFAGLGG